MTSEADNRRQWDGHSPGRYEVWYLTFNDPATGDGFWIRYTLEAPADGHGEPYAQLWFARFASASGAEPARATFGINRRQPIATMTAVDEPFSVTIGANRLAHDAARGALSGGGHAAEWDLQWTPNPRTMHWLPSVMYRRGGVGETTVLSPSPDVSLRGTVVVDGRTYTLDGAPGGQTHLWGRKHAFAWGWAHCNAFDGAPGLALELLTVRLRRRGLTLPWLTLATLRTPDEELAWNRFDQAIVSPRPVCETGRLRFAAVGLTAKLEGELTAPPERFVRAEYADPDGEPAWCHNTCAADLKLTLSRRVRGRWKVERELASAGRAHFELGARDPDPAVTRLHQTIE
ncbi:MAG TPA: hypothetical protein VHE35_32960 [Kofleriaceae bacterium]|nr:hypothetical protein [Kofleriaceae bacterium]